MVGPARGQNFRHDESGISLTEGLIVFPLMVFVITVIIEFSYGMYQWNQAAKAAQLGARILAVSDPITSDFATVFAFDSDLGGQVVQPDNTIVSQCGPGANPCESLDRLVNGNGRWPGMQAYYNRISEDNVFVSYEQTGLGYHGRPTGPVVTLRLELRNVTFELPLVGALMNALGANSATDFTNITVPAFPVTVTTEDLQTCTGGCP